MNDKEDLFMSELYCIEHVSYEGPGTLKEWCEARGVKLKRVRLWAGDSIPRVEDVKKLVVMGGPMSIYDELDYDWLADEKEFIKSVCQKWEPKVLGVCLGAQIIADALGALVYPNEEAEIGFYPVTNTKNGNEGPLSALAEGQVVLHWHGDKFEIPSGATSLKESEACKTQAFWWDERVLGIQFHLETDEACLENMIDMGEAQEKSLDTWVQSEEELLANKSILLDMKEAYFKVLDKLFLSEPKKKK
jgi:GMP synthase (glutamine-hydrolysing)